MSPSSLCLHPSAFTTRRSIRRYTDQPVSIELINQVLEAASWAPSAHNRQPWRFAVVQTLANKQKLAVAMGAKLRADLERDGVSAEIIHKDTTRSYQRITQAPVLILLSLSMRDMDSYSDATRNHNEYVMAVQSTAMAGQNLLLAAHQLGLATCWMCAPLFAPTLVQHTLDLPPDWQPQALITLGYAAETRTKTRAPVGAKSRYF